MSGFLIVSYWKRKMYSKKQEYIPLKSQEYITIQRPLTRIILCCLGFIQLVVLTQWILTLFMKPEDIIKHLSISSSANRDSVIFVSAEFLREYEDDHTGWVGEQCTVTTNSEKFDCYPELGANEHLCQKRKCCWEPVNNKKYLGVPWCYYPKNYGGYKMLNLSHSKTGVRAFLNRTFPSPYADDIKIIRIDILYHTSHTVHIKIIDAEAVRYEPPYPAIPVVGDITEDPQYQVKYTSRGFKVFRNDDEDPLFDCENVGGFIFADQFLQLSSRFKGKIYGLGEHQTTLQLDTNWTRFTMFNRDGIPMRETNLYGSHPFYLVIEASGKSHGVFFHNSNAMDILLQPLPAVTFRSIGGIFDFYIFTGPTPGDVIKQYTEIIGRPFFPPYWSLGFHLSRFGYKNTSDIRKVWKRTREAKIPFDTQWHDIDYMEDRNDFTIDKTNYGDLPEFVKEIHEAGMHYVVILDPGISGCEPKGTYLPYDEGLAMDVFIKNQDGSVFVGKVWNPNCTVFPDFTAPNATLYWSEQIREFHRKLPFDGIWIDMNEPSNFLDGSFHGCPSNKWENPVYIPYVVDGMLRKLTICMSSLQAAGLHYNLHNLYGFTEAIATNEALKELKKRPFIISRSTYPGIGKYAGHWSGDIVSTWHAMRLSIPKMLSFSLFGVAMMGADICGFNGNTTIKLCQRWSQLGAFYPFSRNHNSDDCIEQDPVALGEEVVNATRKALNVRYTLLPYLYTLFYKAHAEGETVARPLFFEFWNDPRTHSMDESFLWGCCVLIVPVLEEYATTVKTYFPAARWYDWYTGLGMESNGTEVTLHAASDTIPVFIRGGVILPTQPAHLTTTLSRLNKIELIVASNTSLCATGNFYWDDGESLESHKKGEYGIVDFFLTPVNLTSHVYTWGYSKVPQLGSIKILGFLKPVQKIYFNGKEMEFKWNPTSLTFSVDVTHPINIPFVLEWKRVGE